MILWGFGGTGSPLQYSPETLGFWVGEELIMGLLREKEDSVSVCSKKTYFTARSRARLRVITCSRPILGGDDERQSQTCGLLHWYQWHADIFMQRMLFCFYLVSLIGHIVPPKSSFFAMGPSTERFWFGCSAASRVWAWTKARPRDCKIASSILVSLNTAFLSTGPAFTANAFCTLYDVLISH